MAGQEERLGSISWHPFAHVPLRRHYWGDQRRGRLKLQSLARLLRAEKQNLASVWDTEAGGARERQAVSRWLVSVTVEKGSFTREVCI